MTISKELLFAATFGFLYIPCTTLTGENPNHQIPKQYSISPFNPARDKKSAVELCRKEWDKIIHLRNNNVSNISDDTKQSVCNNIFENYNNNAQLYGFKVLHENDKFAGFVSYKLENQKKEGSIELLAIDSDFRGKGYGKNLLVHSLEELDNKNINSIDICVLKNNIPALNLYKKIGFNKTSNRQNIADTIACLEYDPTSIQNSLSSRV